MTLASLALTDFRSYAGARLEMTSRPVVLHGPNGAGKTNLLEAISLLTPGKGLRGATMGLHSMAGYAGGFLGPLGVGVVLDLAGGARGDGLDVLRWNIVNEKLKYLGRKRRVAFVC